MDTVYIILQYQLFGKNCDLRGGSERGVGLGLEFGLELGFGLGYLGVGVGVLRLGFGVGVWDRVRDRVFG